MNPSRGYEHGIQWNSGTDRPGFTDVHCHCLPGFDDGPAERIEALALCRSLVADGIERVVATPHQLGRFEDRYDADAIRDAVSDLNRCLLEAQIPLTVLPGADVRLDERIPMLLGSDNILTVAEGGRYLLLELPHEIFIDPETLLSALASMEVTAIVTHPERHAYLARNPQYVRRWVKHRPCLQITAASFGGAFGRQSQEAAWAFIHAPMPILVATDAHDTHGRAPRMSEAYNVLAKRFGYIVADILCVENPRRAVEGQSLLMLTTCDLHSEATR